jgi:Holliday junction resolvase
MRRRGKVDEVQAVIVDTLRQAGAEVLSLAALGSGVPDLLVYYEGTFYFLEVKTARSKKGSWRLTRDQESFHARWPVTVVCNASQALGVVCGLH